MSQYSRPLAVLVGAPVTFVGPPMAGFFAAALWAGAVWATTRLASASIVMARMTMRVFIIPLFLCVCKVPEFYLFNSVCSIQCNHINFNQDVFRKPGYFDGGARRRRLLEVAAVNFVHGGEIPHIFQENRAAKNFLQATVRGLQNGIEVL